MRGGWLMNWLSSLTLTGLTLFVLITMLLAAFVGHAVHRWARRRAKAGEKEDHNQESYLVGSMLGPMPMLRHSLRHGMA